MQNQCKNCSQSFEITDEDLAFYKRMDVPAPMHCPPCRQQRRLAWRNERTLYARNCDFCDEHLISIYPEKTPFPVYCNKCWWSDKWDPMEFGQDFEFDKDFTAQFKELQNKVPRQAIYLKNALNSDYCNHSENLKNCYLCICVAKSEGIYYSKWCIDKNRDLADCFQMRSSELCYECQYMADAYNVVEAFCCDGSRDCAVVYDCKQCTNCFLCWNLRHKEYCIENEQLSKEEYEKRMANIDLGSYEQLQKYKKHLQEIVKNTAIIRANKTAQCENCTGDMMYKNKNVKESFLVTDSEDCKYCYNSAKIKDCYDAYEPAFNCELQYDSHACNRGTRVVAGHVSYDVDSVKYVDSCHNSSDLFGSIGLRHKRHCILNKQYSEDEYQELSKQIVEHMKKTGEYGEFFPISISPFCYNETVAQEYFPLNQNQAREKGYNWKEDDSGQHKQQTYEIPDNIKEAPNSITQETLACIDCEKNYRIIASELILYRKINIPIPRKCPQCRHLDRMKMTNPQQLYDNICRKCNGSLRTSFEKDCIEKIYCQKCYEEAIY